MVRTAVAAGGVALLVALGAAGLAVGPAGPPAARPAAGPTAGAGAPDDAGSAAGVPQDPGAVAGSGRSAVTAPPAATFRPPLDAPVLVTRPFQAPAQRWSSGHRGVDLAAHRGQQVRAPEGGVVTWAGTVVDRGVVTVAHGNGLRSSVEPVQWSVRPGQRVLRGQVLGTVAGTPGHCLPATCLHWGLRRGETYLDPMRWVLGRGPVVLLPADRGPLPG